MLGYSALARFRAENAAGFFAGVVFAGFRCFFALSLPPSSSPPLFLVAGLGFPPPPSLRLLAGRRTPATWSGGSVMHLSSRFFSPLSARVGRRFLPPILFSFCPLSLSLASLLQACTVNLVDPASSHTLVSKTKPGMSQRKRFTARLQTAH